MLTVFPTCPRPCSVWTRPIGTFLEHSTEEASCPRLASLTVAEQPLDSKTAWRIFSLYAKSHEQLKGSKIYFSSHLVTEKMYIAKTTHKFTYILYLTLPALRVAQGCWSPSQLSEGGGRVHPERVVSLLHGHYNN